MKNLIMTMFNLDEESIESFTTLNIGNDTTEIRIKLKPTDQYCEICGTKMIGNGTINKPVNHQFLTGRNIKLIYQARRYRCRNCGCSIVEKNPFAMKGFTTSILTMDNIMRDLRNPLLNYTTIAANHNSSVTMVENYLDSFVVLPKPTLPTNMGIDEIRSDMAKRRDAKYLGVIIDNDTYDLVEILPSRNKIDLANFFSSYTKEEREKVQFITTDMWKPYKEVAQKYFKGVKVACDPFHVVKHLSDAFTKIRIRITNSLVYGSPSYYLLKHWHKLLESDKYDLDGEKKYNSVFKKNLNYGDIKNMLLSINDELKDAYYLKELYQQFNKEATYENAEDELNRIISVFQSYDIKEYREFISTVIEWKKEIINSFIISPMTNNRLSNAKTEAMNNGIRKNISCSNGLSNFNRFRKRMIYCFNDKAYYAISDNLASLTKKKGNNKNKK